MNLDRSAQSRRSLDRAATLLEAGMPDDALAAVREATRIAGHSAEALLAEARAQIARHQPRRAIAALDEHDARFAQRRFDPHARLIRAQATVQIDDAEHNAVAQRAIAALTEDYPDDVRPHRLAAGLALRTDQRELAAAHLWEVVRLEPHDEAARQTLAWLKADDDPQAAADLIDANTAHYDSAQAQNQLTSARLYRELHRDNDAETAYRQLLGLTPEDRTVWLEAGTLADSKGEDDLAMLRLERAAALGKYRHRPSLAALAEAHMHAGRMAEAGRLWFRAIRLANDDVGAWAGLIVCAIAAGRSNLARRAVRGISRHSTADERRPILAAMWQHVAGYLAIDPLNEDTQEQPASLTGLLHHAESVLVEHAARFPHRADTHYHLAMCRKAMQRTADARESITRALSLNAGYCDARHLDEELETLRLAA